MNMSVTNPHMDQFRHSAYHYMHPHIQESLPPADGTTTLVTPLAKACDTKGGCTIVEGSAVTVTLTDALSLEAFGSVTFLPFYIHVSA